MSEVVSVAVIAGGSILTAAIAGLVTWSVSKSSSAVELAKTSAGTERLREENREKERRERKRSYQQFVNAFNDLYNALGVELTFEQAEKAYGPYLDRVPEVILFGAADVSTAASKVNDVYEKIWLARDRLMREFPRKSYAQIWREATEPIKVEMKSAGAELIPPIREDVVDATN